MAALIGLVKLEKIGARAEALRAEEARGAPLWWYLSFAEESAPKGRGFLGAIVLRAPGFITAVDQANLLGINPGGEVLGTPLPFEPPQDWIDRWSQRLLTRAEALALPKPDNEGDAT
ncbi:MAG: hypothetical protein ACRDZY_12610 [Acidimicrobiales bacterium]